MCELKKHKQTVYAQSACLMMVPIMHLKLDKKSQEFSIQAATNLHVSTFLIF